MVNFSMPTYDAGLEGEGGGGTKRDLGTILLKVSALCLPSLSGLAG
jgi:hypothetical protein